MAGQEGGVTVGDRMYRRPYYRGFVFAGVALLVMIVSIPITLALLQRHLDQVATIIAFVFAALLFAAWVQHHTPYEVTISTAGFQTRSVIGTRARSQWEDVRDISLIRSGSPEGPVTQLWISMRNGPTYKIVKPMSDFDDLITRIRALQPELVRDPASRASPGNQPTTFV